MPKYVSVKDANAPTGALQHSIICHEHKSINNRNLCSNRKSGAKWEQTSINSRTIYMYLKDT